MVRRWKPEEELVKKLRKWLGKKEKPRRVGVKQKKYFRKDGLLICQPYKPRNKARLGFLVVVCP